MHGKKRLTEGEYEQISRAIVDRTGLVFPPSRESELRDTLWENFAASGCYPSIPDYVRHIENDSLSRRDLRRLISSLTVGETYFFRNDAQFEVLRRDIIPRLVSRRSRTTRTLRLWSAGCASGEEAYSLAILLQETVPRIDDWSIFILATDISEDALRQAERGEYREWSFRDVDPHLRERYFSRTEEGWKIHPGIRNMVTFRYLNLIDDTYPLSSTGTNFMDVILCRNVMIYFRPEIALTVTRRFSRCLGAGGCLVVGHSENADTIHPDFRLVMYPKASVYIREEKTSEWDRGLRLRFRGSGALPGNVLPVHAPQPAEARPHVADPERFEIKEETALFEEGADLYNTGQTGSALDRFRRVLELNPNNHRACYMVALVEANRNHLRKAGEFCRRAIAACPLSLEAHYLMAVIAREEGDRPRELEYLRKVIYINGDFILGHYQLGVYYLGEGNHVLARKSLKNALKILDKWKENDYIEGTEGMTVGRLRESALRSLSEIDDGDGLDSADRKGDH
jgi:chemotaxis protein methyltransferase CheR